MSPPHAVSRFLRLDAYHSQALSITRTFAGEGRAAGCLIRRVESRLERCLPLKPGARLTGDGQVIAVTHNIVNLRQ